jgi:DNA-binding LacI/PurR family transcriptional regulator
MPEVRIVVASQSFTARYQGLVYTHLRRALQDDERIDEVAITRPREPEFQRQVLREVMQRTPRPAAFIGICLTPDPESVAEYRAAGIPMVLVDAEAEGATTVACDNLAGGLLAGQHLLRTGRKAIAVVSGPARDYNAVSRVRGLARALAEQRAPPATVLETADYLRKDGEAAMERLLRDHPGADAIFCATGDTAALGMLSVARDAHVRVPEQLAIVGYDDIPLAAISDPPLTTVRQPLDAIAREAHRLATTCAEELLVRPKRVLLPPSLVVRSTA